MKKRILIVFISALILILMPGCQHYPEQTRKSPVKATSSPAASASAQSESEVSLDPEFEKFYSEAKQTFQDIFLPTPTPNPYLTGPKRDDEYTSEEISAMIDIVYTKLVSLGFYELTEDMKEDCLSFIEDIYIRSRGYIDFYSEESPEYCIVSYFLSNLGWHDFDYDTYEVTYMSDTVYAFDAEVYDINSMYTICLGGISAINGRDFDISDIKETAGQMYDDVPFGAYDDTYEDAGGMLPENSYSYTPGYKSQVISFKLNGTGYTYRADYNYDWFDSGFLDFMNSALEKEGIDKKLYFYVGIYQDIVMVYNTPEWAEDFIKVTGVEIYDTTW